MTSPSLKRETLALPSWMFRLRATFCASLGFAFPVNSIRLSNDATADPLCQDWIERLAGEEGFEPSYAGIKIRCLNHLGDSPAELLCYARRGCCPRPCAMKPCIV